MQILAKVYLARSDVGFSVRSAAVHVWKTLVTNTPRTLSEILPCLMENIIELLASEGDADSHWHPGVVVPQGCPSAFFAPVKQ